MASATQLLVTSYYEINSVIDLRDSGQVEAAIVDLTARVDVWDRRGDRFIACGIACMLIGFFGIIPACTISNDAFPINWKNTLIYAPVALAGVLMVAGLCINDRADKIRRVMLAVTAYQNDPDFRAALNTKQIQIISLKNLVFERQQYVCSLRTTPAVSGRAALLR